MYHVIHASTSAMHPSDITRNKKSARQLHDMKLHAIMTSKEMEQGLGRLGFAANALTWERPFLGVIFLVCSNPEQEGCLEDACHVEDIAILLV